MKLIEGTYENLITDGKRVWCAKKKILTALRSQAC